MSTRCQIVVMENETTAYPVKAYKHSDGYPDGVLPWLEPFARAFAADRGADPEYMVAQLIRHQAMADMEEWLRWGGFDPRTWYTGWGACVEWHTDIEYFYKVFSDGRVECWKVGSGDILNEPGRWPPGKLVTGNSGIGT